MKKFFKKATAILFMVSCLLGLTGPSTAQAATTPSLGIAGTFAILASTFTRNVAVTAITGDLGYTTLGGSGSHTLTGTAHVANATYDQAGIDQGTALTALAAQTCDFNFGSPTDLSLLPQPLAPGVYCITAAASIGTAGVTLSGSGTYIFRVTGALTTVDNSVVTLANSASSCNVFWTPGAATTLGANSTFVGTVIDAAGITIGNASSLVGRALAFGGTVTADSNTINSSCVTAAATPAPSSTGFTGSINVVKIVINDNGGTKTISDFPLFINGAPITSGATYNFSANSNPDAFVVTETSDPTYASTFSGDCASNGHMNLNAGNNKFCIITNDDIGVPIVVPPVPPLIDVIKVPAPLALPNGPGPVLYTYSLRNIGTVPVTNVTMVGDTCSPIALVSGDINGNAKLDLTETWVHTCSTTLTETHTNTVVATGWANGLSAVDIASATVVVGIPVIPPLIHVTKIPSPLTLLAGGGMVTYTKRVTNPGTVPLQNVRLTDDMCGPVTYISGDTDGDSELDTTETWVYTCRTNLTETTINTVTASGDANGLTAKDLAIATVVVATAVPALPKTGFTQSVLLLPVLTASLGAFLLFIFVLRKRQTR